MPSIPWEEKKKRIQREHPDALDTNWDNIIQKDPDLFARIIGDVVKSSSSGSRPGKRPNLENKEAYAIYSKLAGEDFSDRDFLTSFKALIGDRSLRSVSNKTGLSVTFIHQVLNEQKYPSYETMKKIALGFKKDPSYFMEYRIGYILGAFEKYLTSAPETSASWYLKLRN